MSPEDIEFVCARPSNENAGWDGYDFYWKGKKCSSKIISGINARRIEALTLINFDLSSCWGYLCLMMNDNDSLVQSALYKALVITYAKCFVSGKNRGLSLKEESVFKEADLVLYKTHRSILEFRHKFVAHSDSKLSHQAEVCIIYPPENVEGLKPHVITATLEYQCPTGKSMENHIHTVSFVMDYVSQLIESCKNHIATRENA